MSDTISYCYLEGGVWKQKKIPLGVLFNFNKKVGEASKRGIRLEKIKHDGVITKRKIVKIGGC